MKRTAIVLLVLCLVALTTAAAPAVAEGDDESDELEARCVTIYLDEPQVVVDQWCVIGMVTGIIT